MTRPLLVLLLLLASSAGAQSPGDGSFTYQGELRDGGAPIDGAVDLRFTLYDADTGGASMGGAQVFTDVNLIDGVFAAQMSFGTNAFDGSPRWLEIEVRSPHDPTDSLPWTTLDPRQAVSSTPYAQYAEQSSIWERSGSAVTNRDPGFVGINRDYQVGAEYFGVHAPVTSGFGGMYVSTEGGDGWPFYGYYTPTATAWTYLDGSSGTWRLVLNSQIRLTLLNSGNLGIGVDDPSERLAVAGTIQSTSGGFRFPDGTVQSTAAVSAGPIPDGHSLDAADGSPTNALMINNAGKGSFIDDLGVGTLSPAFRLHVEEASAASNLVRLERDADASASSDLLELKTGAGSVASGQLIEGELGTNVVFRVWNDGDVTADGTFTPGGADFAELVKSTQGLTDFEPGDVVVIDPNATRGFRKSADASSRLVAGVYSTKPGVLASERDWDSMERRFPGGESVARKTIDHARDYDEFPLAIVGIVPCKVSSENGPVRAGDLLVSAGTSGHAMRAEDPRAGTIIGKALEDMKGSTDMVQILVTLQ